MRRALLALAAAALAGGCWRSDAPNAVVLITMESVSEDDTSAGQGALSTTDTTPPEGGTSFAPPIPEDLDDLATLGIRFASAFAPSGSAFASLASLHTGRAPEEAGVYSDLDRLEETPTLAESLALRGVRCAAFVAREALAKGCGLERGFESYVARPRRESLANEARAWLDSTRLARPDQPVFLWLHLSSARPPYQPADPWAERLAKGVDPSLGSLASLARFAKNPSFLTPQRREDVARLHAAAILQDAAAAKEALAALRPALQDFRRTMIVFVGTNGDAKGEGGVFGSRRWLRDSTLHVPLFLWRRGVQPYPRVAAPVVELVDVTATIAATLDAPRPEGARGRDLFEILGDPRAADRVAYATWEDRIRTIRTSRERLVCNPNEVEPGGWPAGPLLAEREEHFDLRRDPFERQNLAASPTERIEALRLRLERAHAAVVPRPPRRELDPARLKLLAAEEIHDGDGHPAGPVPASACGSKKP